MRMGGLRMGGLVAIGYLRRRFHVENLTLGHL